ncbi:hypothetical protein EKO04_004984 [Ascochyta lentis]|uniref:Uncharacterized protein n=1 Tax=Ascochyta lentis TaxID=205686 RepID=A0A8H7J362_9PLEO|nr:hypothetical protein EKO04_004984 [Ascochyta lentis]
MTASNSTTAMDVDRTIPPSVKSESTSTSAQTCDTAPTETSPPPSPPNTEKSQPPFVNAFECLPSTGHPKQAHITNTATCHEHSAFQLQDAVATTLYLASPSTLTTFLSPTVHVFKAIFKREKRGPQLVIWRKGIEVLIGLFTHHTSFKAFGFEHVAGLLIGYDGCWYVKATAGNAFSSTKWAEVWSGDFECYGGVAKMVVEREERGMQDRASMLAASMLAQRFWEFKVDVKVT